MRVQTYTVREMWSCLHFVLIYCVCITDYAQLIPESLESSLFSGFIAYLMEKPCANSKHKDAKSLMRPTHVKPSNTNTLTATELKRGYAALLAPRAARKAANGTRREEVLRA